VSRTPGFIARSAARWSALSPGLRALNSGLLGLAAGMVAIALWVALDEGAPGWAETLTGALGWAALALVAVLMLQGRRRRTK
jgi:hypothetical protein